MLGDVGEVAVAVVAVKAVAGQGVVGSQHLVAGAEGTVLVDRDG